MHVTTTGAQLRISQEFLTRQTGYCNEEGKGEQVVVAAKGFHFTMGLKKVCPRNPELNPVVTCITPHASHNHLANTEKKKTHIMSCYIRHACHTSHSRKTPKVQNSSSKFKITHCRMGPKVLAHLAKFRMNMQHTPIMPRKVRILETSLHGPHLEILSMYLGSGSRPSGVQ